MTKETLEELKTLTLAFIVVNVVTYLAFSLCSFSFNLAEWNVHLRLVFALFISGTFTSSVAWLLFKPE